MTKDVSVEDFRELLKEVNSWNSSNPEKKITLQSINATITLLVLRGKLK